MTGERLNFTFTLYIMTHTFVDNHIYQMMIQSPNKDILEKIEIYFIHFQIQWYFLISIIFINNILRINTNFEND